MTNGRGKKMAIKIGSGFVIGLLLIGAGYLVRTKQMFSFLAGFREVWEPVNQERLGKRIGVLLSILGVIAIFTAIATIWFGDIVATISGVLALIAVILVVIVIALDQIGY